ncbi:PAS domain-containing protein [Flagellimonas pelagia]|uniref:PAS domain-containing protein n=1 Tax=Flagellimonas pelagia TaxID=2306998 RepID=UPI0016051614|nr:PAS domain-containing protein [Allomuricauda maritima]
MKAVERIEQHYLLRQLPQATALVGLDGSLVDASDSWLALFGLPPKNYMEANIFKVLEHVGDLKEKLSNHNTFSFRHDLGQANNRLWLESTLTPWYDEKENIIGSIVQTHDISREVEKELEIERINAILKQNPKWPKWVAGNMTSKPKGYTGVTKPKKYTKSPCLTNLM